MKVAITTSSFAQYSQEPLTLLAAKGITPVINPHGRALTEQEVTEMLQGCIAIAAGTEPLTAKVMESNPQLKVISRCGVGMDSVDVQTATQRGITVCCTPNGPTLAVVELTLGYALDLMRKVSEMDKDIRGGVWKKKMGNLLSGKTVGIIGFGRIGQAVAKNFAFMGCTVNFFDPIITSVADTTYTYMPLDALLATSDIITLHCSKPANGALVLDAAAITSMKKGAWLINAARGGIIDEVALEQSLRSGALTGAALDVFGKEPYTGTLCELPQVILTPHIGSYAKEARIQMEIDTIKNLIESLEKLGEL